MASGSRVLVERPRPGSSVVALAQVRCARCGRGADRRVGMHVQVMGRALLFEAMKRHR